MKRVLVLLALAGGLAAPGLVRAQTIHVGLGGQLSSLVNLPVTVPVVADLTGRPERLGSYALRIRWNPAVLQVLGGSDGTFGGAQVNEDSLPFGVVRVAGVNPAGAGGLVTLVNVRLLPLVKDTTSLELTVSELFAAGSFADLLPSAVVSGGLFCPARGLWGDIDGDGNANSRDALIALSNAVGLDVSAFDIVLGDVDANGATNARDALIVLSNAVGIDTGVFRVLRMAGGACSSNAPVAMTLTPLAVELVTGQSVQFEAWAPDSATGALQALADATWRSSASSVLVVDPTGDAVARDTGTATVTAFRGTKDSAQTTVHVIARRTTHWVDAQALNAKNRLGTAALPFGSLDEGVGFAQGGDTLRIRVGRYEVQGGPLTLARPMVLIGDTAADGSRPTVAGPGALRGGTGVQLFGVGRTELQDLAFDGFATGVLVEGADCVLLRGVRASQVLSGLVVAAPAHCVRIERSALLGTGGQLGYGQSVGGVVVAATLDTLVIDGTEIADLTQGLLLVQPPDSTAVRRSHLHDFLNAALTNTPYSGGGAPPAGVAARGAPAGVASSPVLPGPMAGGRPDVVIDSSRLERTTYSYNSLVYLSGGALDLTLSHSYLSNPGGDVLSLNPTGGSLTLRADSIVAPPERQHSYWLYAQGLDSLAVDSLQLVGAQSAYLYSTPLVRLTNSTLRDVRYAGLQVSFPSGTGGVLALDNVAVHGDPRDDAAASGVTQSYGRLDGNRFTGSNLSEGISSSTSDSSTTVTNSVFQHVAHPVFWAPTSAVAPGTSALTVRGSTFDGYQFAVESYDGRVVVDSNAFANGTQAIYVDTPRPMTVTRNVVSGTGSAVELYNFDSTAVVTVTDNTITAVPVKGIYVAGSAVDSLRTRFDVERNVVTCDAAGATSAAGIDLLEARLAVLDNQVGNCFAGIRTSVSTSTQRTDSIVGNTVAAPAGAQLGIGAAGNVAVRIGRNTVTGPATGVQLNGLIDAPGVCGAWACPDVGASVVTVDSNTVTGGTVWGIHVRDVDSVLIAGNTVTNLGSPSGAYVYSEDQGGIAVLGILRYFARIAGNVVRHIHGNGIVVNAGDTLTTVVDSNVVGDVDSTGVYFAYSGWYSGIAVTRNLLAGARRDGVRILGYGSAVVTGNNIEGNLAFGVNVLAPVSAINGVGNWWNDPLGPRCPVNGGCDPASTGDSVQNVSWSPPLLAPNPAVPPMPVPAPPVLARAVAVAPTASASSAGSAVFPAAGRRPAAPVRVVPQGARGAVAERWAAAERAREELAAERTERDQRLRARRAARESARQAAPAPPSAARRQEVRP